MSQPLVSVVTPCLNALRFLPENLRSVESQDYDEIEHIVVDGGSSDGTVELLRHAEAIRWTSGPDRGQSDALNKGLTTARGEILAWLNADDYYLPHAVASAVRAFAENPDAVAVYGNVVVVDAAGRELSRAKSEPFDLDRALSFGNVIPQPAVFFRRRAFEQVGPLETSYHYAMDFDLWLRLARVGRLRYVDDYWAAFRLHPHSKTGTALKRMWREERAVSRAHGGPLLSKMLVRHSRDNYRLVDVVARAALSTRRLLRRGVP